MLSLNNMKMYTAYLEESYRHIFNNTIIKSWGYLYYDFSGRYLQLMSDKVLLHDFLNHELFVAQIIDNLSNDHGQFYSSDITNDTFISDSIKRILMLQGYTYFFDIFRNHSDYAEIYTFATIEEPHYANNYILNNLEILKTISDDLSVRCRRLLTKSNILILPNDFVIQINELRHAANRANFENLKDNIVKSQTRDTCLYTKVNDNVFDFNKLPFSFLATKELTHREKEMIYLYYQGFSTPRIATILEISRRTVDKHFESIRAKLNCESIGQIIPALLRYDHQIQNTINKK